MAFLPLPPTLGAMSSPMPGDMGGASTSAPPDGSGLAALLGGGPPDQGMGFNPMGDPTQAALGQLDSIQQMVIDLIRQFPGSEQFGQQIVEGLEGFRQMVAVTASPEAQMMGGAQQML